MPVISHFLGLGSGSALSGRRLFASGVLCGFLIALALNASAFVYLKQVWLPHRLCYLHQHEGYPLYPQLPCKDR